MADLLKLAKVEDKVDEAIRLSKEVLRYCELIYKDRELINENNESVAGLKQRVVDSAQHIENVVKDSQFEQTKKIVEVADVVEQKGEEIKVEVAKGRKKDKTVVEKVLGK